MIDRSRDGRWRSWKSSSRTETLAELGRRASHSPLGKMVFVFVIVGILVGVYADVAWALLDCGGANLDSDGMVHVDGTSWWVDGRVGG